MSSPCAADARPFACGCCSDRRIWARRSRYVFTPVLWQCVCCRVCGSQSCVGGGLVAVARRTSPSLPHPSFPLLFLLGLLFLPVIAAPPPRFHTHISPPVAPRDSSSSKHQQTMMGSLSPDAARTPAPTISRHVRWPDDVPVQPTAYGLRICAAAAGLGSARGYGPELLPGERRQQVIGDRAHLCRAMQQIMDRGTHGSKNSW